MRIKENIKVEGIFDEIENGITHYLLQKKVSKLEFWKLGLNVFELALYLEEYLKTGNINLEEIKIGN